MKQVIITGGTSFLGLPLVRRLREAGVRVDAVVRPDSPRRDAAQAAGAHILPFALSEIDRLRALGSVEDGVFYHLAWDGVRGAVRQDEARQQANVDAALRALRVCADLGVRAFVCAGSQAEYGRTTGPIIEGESREAPDTAYGRAKLRLCREAADFCRARGIRFVWARVFSVYGPGDFEGSLVMSALRRMLADEPVALTDCTQRWDFLHVRDAAAALHRLGEREDAAGLFHVASGESRPLRAFVEEMRAVSGSHSRLCFGEIPQPPGGPVSLETQPRRLRALGWRPQVPFADGIAETAESIREDVKWTKQSVF